MNKLNRTLRIVGMAAFLLAASAAVHAQAIRTWVSGVGDDTFPCSRTAPCRTFAGAIIKTAVNGEINVIDAGSYGTANITKSITIDGIGSQAGVTASNTTGFIINLNQASTADPLHKVVIRNVSINGTGTCVAPCGGTRTGIDGIRVVHAGVAPNPTVIVENVSIENFTQSGIEWQASGGTLIVRNSHIRNNTLEGIKVDAATTLTRVDIDNTATDFNQEGVRLNDNVRATITRSRAVGNTLNGYSCAPDGTGVSELSLSLSNASNNLQWGVAAGGSGAFTCTVRINDNDIINNAVSGLQVLPSGSILSTGRNRITAPTMAPSGPFTEQ